MSFSARPGVPEAHLLAPHLDAVHGARETAAPLRRPRHATNRSAPYGLVLLAFMLAALTFGVLNRQFLPSRYFNDDLRLQTFIEYPYLLSRDGSFSGTVSWYRAVHLGGHATLVAIVALTLFDAAVLLALRRRDEKVWGATELAIAGPAVMLSAVYLAQFSKELFVLPLVVLFLLKARSRAITIAWFTYALIYAHEIRSYWFAVVGVYVLNLFILRRLSTRVSKVAYFFSVVTALASIVEFGAGAAAGYERESVLLSLSFDPTTAIASPFGTSHTGSILNSLYIFVTLVVPVPLSRAGIIYIFAGVYVLILWLVVGRRLFSECFRSEYRSRAFDAVAFVTAYVSVQALFEPDYGSYLRHLCPFFPLFLLIRRGSQEASEGTPKSSMRR